MWHVECEGHVTVRNAQLWLTVTLWNLQFLKIQSLKIHRTEQNNRTEQNIRTEQQGRQTKTKTRFSSFGRLKDTVALVRWPTGNQTVTAPNFISTKVDRQTGETEPAMHWSPVKVLYTVSQFTSPKKISTAGKYHPTGSPLNENHIAYITLTQAHAQSIFLPIFPGLLLAAESFVLLNSVVSSCFLSLISVH